MNDWTNSIAAPFGEGDKVRLPAGTIVRSMHPQHTEPRMLKRAQTITVNHTLNGWVDLWNDRKRGVGYVILPSVRWPGTGGYWQEAQVTPELCKAHGCEVPALPTMDAYGYALDVIPGYGPGYDNRWANPLACSKSID